MFLELRVSVTELILPAELVLLLFNSSRVCLYTQSKLFAYLVENILYALIFGQSQQHIRMLYSNSRTLRRG